MYCIVHRADEGRMNNYELWQTNRDVIRGLVFQATLQLRTPLRVLIRDGELHTDISRPPPTIAQELWEGSWLCEVKTWKELGVNMPEFTTTHRASEIGAVPDDGRYRQFLIKVRTIVEMDSSIDVRIRHLRAVLRRQEWGDFVSRHRPARIVRHFFPHFVETIPGLPRSTINKFFELNLSTPAQVETAPDHVLLGICGNCSITVAAVRRACNSITVERENGRVDAVTR
jgi:hypothetical protein